MNEERNVDVLYIEDDVGDVELAKIAFKSLGELNLRLHVVEDGERALQYLHRKAPYQSAPVPDLILLDLNLPRVDGREVLKELKSDPKLKSIPVLVLSTSTAEQDIDKAYLLGANVYIPKPIGFAQYTKTFRALYEFWCSVVALPS